MIAYRAETAMANSLREHLTRARRGTPAALLLVHHRGRSAARPRGADLDGTSTPLGERRDRSVIEKLCEELNATETVFPRTNMRLVLKLGST